MSELELYGNLFQLKWLHFQFFQETGVFYVIYQIFQFSLVSLLPVFIQNSYECSLLFV